VRGRSGFRLRNAREQGLLCVRSGRAGPDEAAILPQALQEIAAAVALPLRDERAAPGVRRGGGRPHGSGRIASSILQEGAGCNKNEQEIFSFFAGRASRGP